MDKEIRSFDIECRLQPESRIVEGRAIPFNVLSPNYEGFREQVLPEAIDGVLEQSDVFMLYNHSKDKGFLARSKKGKGSLSMEKREDGLYFSFECPTDNLGEYVYQRVKKGELDEMSWAFTVSADKWEKQADGSYIRTISKFDKIYDLSIVDNAYYGSATSVKCKRFDEIQEEERLENERKMKEAEEENKKKLEEYYRKLREDYQDILTTEE